MESRTTTLSISPDRQIRAVVGLPSSPALNAVLILGHGANNTMDHPVVAGIQKRLVDAGAAAVRFNFPYAEEGRKHPDPDAVLEGTLSLIREYVTAQEDFRGLKLFLGGKSMGARIAAQLVSQGAGAAGLVFLGYPLHPPGKPENLRDKPLYALPCPALFIQGSRDPFCTFARLGEVLTNMPVPTDLHVLPGLGHSYEKGKEPVTPEVLDEVGRVVAAWIKSLRP
jgi:predicted alpha/beta-hydrolase family hydrolase